MDKKFCLNQDFDRKTFDPEQLEKESCVLLQLCYLCFLI